MDFFVDLGELKCNECVKFNVVENGDCYKVIKIEWVEDNFVKVKKLKVLSYNKLIIMDLLFNFRC